MYQNIVLRTFKRRKIRETVISLFFAQKNSKDDLNKALIAL